MKKILYILTLSIGMIGCSNNEDELVLTGSFPEDHVIRVTTEVNQVASRAGYSAANLERFGLIIRNSENAAYNYNKQLVGSGTTWSPTDGVQMLWDAKRTPVTVVAYAPYVSGADLETPLSVSVQSNQSTDEYVMASDFLLMKAIVNPEQDLTAEGKLKVALNHAMSKLLVKITINGTEHAAMSKLGDLSINGAIIDGICDLSVKTPVVTPLAEASAVTVSPYRGTDSCECILLPQIIAEGFSINFSYDGKLYIWTAEEAIELKKGVEHTLTLNVNTTAQLTAMQARSWTTGQVLDRK